MKSGREKKQRATTKRKSSYLNRLQWVLHDKKFTGPRSWRVF